MSRREQTREQMIARAEHLYRTYKADKPKWRLEYDDLARRLGFDNAGCLNQFMWHHTRGK